MDEEREGSEHEADAPDEEVLGHALVEGDTDEDDAVHGHALVENSG